MLKEREKANIDEIFVINDELKVYYQEGEIQDREPL